MNFDLSALRNLRGKDLAPEGLLVLEGRIVVEKALDSGATILGALIGEEADDSWIEARKPKFPVVRLPKAELEGLVGFKFHHGVLALAERPPITAFQASVPTSPPASEAEPLALLCLWNVTDPSNLGALIRSAVGLGASAILLGPGCADPFYRRTLRSSMGNVLSLPIFSSSLAELKAAREAGIAPVAASLGPAAIPLSDFQPPARLILILGNEGFGLPGEVLDLCDSQVYIPMRPDLDSLNVAAAGSILMYELFRRR